MVVVSACLAATACTPHARGLEPAIADAGTEGAPVTSPLDAGPAPRPRAGSRGCTAGPVMLNFNNASRTTAELEDVTGDGVDERARITSSALQLNPNVSVGLTPAAAYDLVVLVADLTGDGTADLVLSSPHENQVVVFAGPLLTERAWDDADLRFGTGMTESGFSPMFGTATAVGDFTGDRVPDLLVTQPAEREEGCFGERAPWVFPGPLTRGDRFVTDAGFGVGGSVPFMPKCLGEATRCVDGGVELTFGRCVVYGLPLTEKAEPRSCQ